MKNIKTKEISGKIKLSEYININKRKNKPIKNNTNKTIRKIFIAQGGRRINIIMNKKTAIINNNVSLPLIIVFPPDKNILTANSKNQKLNDLHSYSSEVI